MKTNKEGLTFDEWLDAACFGSRYERLSRIEKHLSIPETAYNQFKAAWEAGEDPTEHAESTAKLNA